MDLATGELAGDQKLKREKAHAHSHHAPPTAWATLIAFAEEPPLQPQPSLGMINSRSSLRPFLRWPASVPLNISYLFP